MPKFHYVVHCQLLMCLLRPCLTGTGKCKTDHHDPGAKRFPHALCC